MDSDIGKSTDRISKLHDSILCHILSFLPTKYAVGTSILSTRWRYLWTCAPNPSFDFDDSLLFHEFSELAYHRKAEIDFGFKNFVNRVLLLTDATCFKKFRLLIESVGNSYDVDTWICTAIKRKVQELELEFCMCLEDDYKLPRMLFTSKTLVVLKLDEGLLLEVPVSVWLPSLKILHLKSVDYEKKDSFQTLFSGCPVLEELYLEKWVRDDHQVLNISVPTLKSLKLMCAPHYFRDEWEDESDDQGFCVVINAPKLEQLKLIDHISEGFLVENLPSLLTARVHLGPNHLRPISNNYGGRIYKLLSGVANVKFLDATLSFPSDVNSPVIPTFHNLTHLTLGGDVELESAWNWNWLTDFLECSPNLKVLTFKRNRILGPAKCWNPPQKVPNCLLLHLEEIEIKEFHAEEYVLEVMIYLLKNAKVLKKMTVDFRNSNIKEECRIWQKMLHVSRGSTTCLLNLMF